MGFHQYLCHTKGQKQEKITTMSYVVRKIYMILMTQEAFVIDRYDDGEPWLWWPKLWYSGDGGYDYLYAFRTEHSGQSRPLSFLFKYWRHK